MDVRYAADGSISGFRILGFATGNYANTCRSCGKQFVGDKRAIMCLDCVIKLVEEKFTPTNSESKPCCKATFALVLEYTLSKVEKCPVCGTPV